MEEIGSPFELKSALTGRQGPVGFVPLTFDLHEGHLSLVRRARAENSTVVVSMFSRIDHGLNHSEVRYPRNAARDRAFLDKARVDLLYNIGPSPGPGVASVEVEGLSRCWEGARYPRHFRIVATAISKLLIAVDPSNVYLGEKDYQQLRVVTELANDFFPGLQVNACPTVRDSDGIALSTSIFDLSPDTRLRASGIFKALIHAKDLVAAGERDSTRLCRAIHEELRRNDLRPDYVAVVDAATLEPLVSVDRKARVLIAAFLDDVRLIDNIRLSVQ
jgi:pantoate--beta-alanine ligase